jgi:hypothetical protein
VKRRRLEVVDDVKDGVWELRHYFNDKVQAVIPIGRDPAVVEAALILASDFNSIQPEE